VDVNVELSLHLNAFFINPSVKCFKTLPPFQNENQSEESQRRGLPEGEIMHRAENAPERPQGTAVRPGRISERGCVRTLQLRAGRFVIDMSGNCVNFVIWQHLPSVDFPHGRAMRFPASGEMCQTVVIRYRHLPSRMTGKKSRCLTPASPRP
jgi:hypothetical protein